MYYFSLHKVEQSDVTRLKSYHFNNMFKELSRLHSYNQTYYCATNENAQTNIVPIKFILSQMC